jgi:polysaccharide chain length determinant protein (PEP-CTERM system associated)
MNATQKPQNLPHPLVKSEGRLPQKPFPPPSMHTGGVDLTPADIIEIVQRRKWYLILPAATIIMAAALLALLLPPSYRSTATILIEDQAIPQDFVMSTVTSYAESRLQTINQRIMSYSRLMEIIQEFDLYRNEREKQTSDAIITLMRQKIKLKPISAEIKDPRTGRATSATIAFSLSFEGEENPKQIQNVASRLTSLFLEENLKERERQVNETYRFLESEAELLRQRIKQIDSAIAEFKSKNINQLPQLLATNASQLAIIEEQERQYRERLNILEHDKSRIQNLMAVTPKGLNRSEVAEKSLDIQRLVTLELQLVEYQSRYKDKHPDLQRTRQEIDDLRKQLDLPPYPKPISSKAKGQDQNPAYLNLQTQLLATEFEIGAIEARLPSLRDSAEQYRRRIEATPHVEEEYNQLLAERTNTHSKYKEMMEKAMQARMAQGLEKEQKGERFTLIDPARQPIKPFKPNRLAIALVGIVLGLGAGLGVAVLKEITDTSVHSVEALSSMTGHPVLAGVPLIVTEAEIRSARIKRYIKFALFAALVIAALILIHFFVMELDILWIKVGQRLGLFKSIR